MAGRGFGRIVAAMILAVVIAGAVHASERVYKWLDKDGVVHYGQQPPPEAKSEAIRVQKGFSAPDTEEPNELSPAEKKAAEEAEYCKAATQNFETLSGGQEVQRKDQYGGVSVVSPEERATERDKAKAAMDKYCKPETPAK